MAEAPKPSSAGSGSEPPLYAPETGLSLFVKLFIVPAGIVAGALGIFLLGSIALEHPKTAEQYLQELRGDSTTKRWQAAFELSRMLNSGEKVQFNEDLRGQLVGAYAEADKDDPKVREYLALVLGALKEKSAVSILGATTVPENTKEIRVNSLWALGNIEDPKGGPAAMAALSDNDRGIQLMAVGALSAMRYQPAGKALRGMLEVDSPDLQFNAAVALARLGDPSGVPVLLRAMGQKTEGGTESGEMGRQQKIQAIEVAKELGEPKLMAAVKDLAKKDEDMRVRDAAIKALK